MSNKTQNSQPKTNGQATSETQSGKTQETEVVVLETTPVADGDKQEAKEPKPKFERLADWKWEPTPRTMERFPVMDDEPKLRAMKNRTSADWGKLFTKELTGRYTHHLQENAELIREFLNDKWELNDPSAKHRKIIQSTVALGIVRFRTLWKEEAVNLKAGRPTTEQFLTKMAKLTEEPSIAAK
jgi:hypothetical protein